MLTSYLATIEVVTLDYMQRFTTKEFHKALDRRRNRLYNSSLKPPPKDKSSKHENKESLNDLFH